MTAALEARQKVAPHIVRGLSIEDYHADPHFISHSQIKDFLERGPRYFYERNIARTLPRTETEAFRFGRAAEWLLQDGESAYRERVHALVGDGRTTDVKAAKKAALAAGKLLVSEEDEQAIFAIRDAVTSDCTDAMSMVAAAEMQVSLRGDLEGLPVQSRPDWCALDAFGPWTMDFKTTKALSDLVTLTDTGFVGGPALVRLGYPTQAALAQHLMAACGYPNAAAYLLIAEKEAPFRAVCVDIAPFLPAAHETLRRAARALMRCYEANAFPRILRPERAGAGGGGGAGGASPAIATLARPKWMEREERREREAGGVAEPLSASDVGLPHYEPRPGRDEWSDWP